MSVTLCLQNSSRVCKTHLQLVGYAAQLVLIMADMLYPCGMLNSFCCHVAFDVSMCTFHHTLMPELAIKRQAV